MDEDQTTLAEIYQRAIDTNDTTSLRSYVEASALHLIALSLDNAIVAAGHKGPEEVALAEVALKSIASPAINTNVWGAA